MSLNLPLLRDAVARWETYRDRRVRPEIGWCVGGDGSSCALGDIAHYSGAQTCGSELGVGDLLGITRERFGDVPYAIFGTVTPYMPLAFASDKGRWPIEEVKRLIAWEEAALEQGEQEVREMQGPAEAQPEREAVTV